MTLIEAFMNKDGMTEAEATAHVQELKERVYDGEDPEEILFEEGLEPDYVMDLIF